MQDLPLGWQSWSPPKKNIFRLPLWDYCPINLPTFSKPTLAPSKKSSISLWCSWHSNGTNIDESLILNQAHKFKNHIYVPEYILIDDGWCHLGDWDKPHSSSFPSWSNMLSELSSLSYKTGLWISPFMVDKQSMLFKNHPDWIVKNHGKPLNVFASYPFFKDLTPKYLLDFTNPEALEYLYHCLDNIITIWDISLLKIDHLYAPYFAVDPKMAAKASQTIMDLFAYLKTKYPHVYTIACGCPFDVAGGLVDAVRISKDINSPGLKAIFPLNHLLYLKRKKLLESKLQISRMLKFPFGIDPDAAIKAKDAEKYHELWRSGKIDVFGLGYNL